MHFRGGLLFEYNVPESCDSGTFLQCARLAYPKLTLYVFGKIVLHYLTCNYQRPLTKSNCETVLNKCYTRKTPSEMARGRGRGIVKTNGSLEAATNHQGLKRRKLFEVNFGHDSFLIRDRSYSRSRSVAFRQMARRNKIKRLIERVVA